MKDKTGMARPWFYRGIRMLEAVGLVTLLYGLASSRWFVAAAGAIVIVTSYWIYRRWFDAVPPGRDTSMGQGDGGD